MTKRRELGEEEGVGKGRSLLHHLFGGFDGQVGVCCCISRSETASEWEREIYKRKKRQNSPKHELQVECTTIWLRPTGQEDRREKLDSDHGSTEQLVKPILAIVSTLKLNITIGTIMSMKAVNDSIEKNYSLIVSDAHAIYAKMYYWGKSDVITLASIEPPFRESLCD